MTILSGRTIQTLKIVKPFCEKTTQNGMSFGVSLAGYDVRANLEEGEFLYRGYHKLIPTVEHLTIPEGVLGIVHPKSTWLRRGLMVQPGVLEPGWRGHPTIAIVVAADHIRLEPDDPIAQIIFHRIDARTNGYSGKYQDQGPLVQEAIFDDA